MDNRGAASPPRAESSDVSLKPNFNDPLFCSSCLKPYNLTDRQPKLLLSCLHKFCNECLKSRFKDSKIICPIDQRVTIVSSVAALSVSLATMKQLEQSQPEEGLPLNCELCDEVHQATHMCVECEQAMCTLAMTTHTKAKSSRNHHLNALDGKAKVSSFKPSLLCPTHDRTVELYCTIDNCLVCLVCVATTHHGHKCQDLNQSYKQNKSNFEKLMSEMKSKQQKVRLSLAKIAIANQELKNSKTRPIIIDYFANLKKAIEQRELQILKEFDDDIKRRTHVLTSQSHQLSQVNESLTNGIDQMEVLLQHQYEAALLAFQAQLASYAKIFDQSNITLEPLEKSAITFVGDIDVINHINQLGAIYDASICVDILATIIEGDGLQQFSQSNKFTISFKNKLGEPIDLKNLDVIKLDLLESKHLIITQTSITEVKEAKGKYQVAYQLAGDFKESKIRLRVTLAGSNLPGSPFTIISSDSHHAEPFRWKLSILPPVTGPTDIKFKIKSKAKEFPVLLKAERFSSLASSTWSYGSAPIRERKDNIDGIIISVNKQVLFAGIGLYGGPGESSASIHLQEEHDAKILAEANHSFYRAKLGTDIEPVMWPECVLLSPGKSYAIRVRQKGKSSKYGKGGKEELKVGSVTIRIKKDPLSTNGTDATCGAIPTLYFMEVTDPQNRVHLTPGASVICGLVLSAKTEVLDFNEGYGFSDNGVGLGITPLNVVSRSGSSTFFDVGDEVRLVLDDKVSIYVNGSLRAWVSASTVPLSLMVATYGDALIE